MDPDTMVPIGLGFRRTSKQMSRRTREDLRVCTRLLANSSRAAPPLETKALKRSPSGFVLSKRHVHLSFPQFHSLEVIIPTAALLVTTQKG